MKTKSISLISVISTLACVSSANAGVIADFYVGGMAGVGGQTFFADGTNTSDTSGMFGAIAGMDIPFLRIEGEYDYFTSSDLKTNAGMLNVYAKMPSTIIMPYIGAGAGMVFGGDYTVENAGIETEYHVKSTTAYQAMLGATIAILAVPIKFDIEGRALYAPNVFEDAANNKPDMLQYQLRAKARFVF